MIIENLLKSVKKQGIYDNVNIEEIAVNITLINDDFLPFSFILDEDEDTLSIVCTDSNGFEKINLINKECILKIAVVYADELEQNNDDKKEENDKMII